MDNTRWCAPVRSCQLCHSKEKTRPCAGCFSVYYCCKEHQKEDWKNHLASCRYYKLVQEPNKPSCLVATRRIPKGTTILKSEPIAIGPSGIEPVCIVCLRPMIYDTMSYQCEECSWPIDVQCQKSSLHQLECSALKKAGFRLDERELWEDWRLKFPTVAFSITVMRILLSKHSAKLLNLSRQEDLKTYANETHQQLVANQVSSYIRNTLKLLQFDHDTVCAVTKVYLTSVLPLTVVDDAFSILEIRYGVGVHVTDALHLQHSCFPNVNVLETLTEPKFVHVIANVDIKPGDKLTASKYLTVDQLFFSTVARQNVLRTLLMPQCLCLRCLHPSELGLHFGSLTCKLCFAIMNPDVGYMVCTKCQFKIRHDQMNNVLSALHKKLLLACQQPNDLVKFIDYGPKAMLHPSHYFINVAKVNYCQLIHKASWEKGATYEFSFENLKRFENYTKDLIARNATLNLNGKSFYIQWLEVHSRYIIREWYVGNITNEEAQELIGKVAADGMVNGMPNPVDRFTALLHVKMVTEHAQQLARLKGEKEELED